MTASTIILPEIKVGLIFYLTPSCKGHLITKIEKNIVYYTDLKHNRNYKNTKTNITNKNQNKLPAVKWLSILVYKKTQ